MSVENFGYEMKPYTDHDENEHALVHYDEFGDPRGFKPIEFKHGNYACFDGRILNCLRRHKGNVAKGGSDFLEVPQAALLSNQVWATLPDGGVTSEDLDELAEMMDLVSKATIPPVAIEKLIDRIAWARGRFSVQNFEVPKEGTALRIVQGRAEELLTVIQELQDEGRGTSEVGSEV